MLGERIKTLRKKKGMSQEELALELLAVLTIVTTKDLKLKALRTTTIFNMIVIGICIDCYLGSWIICADACCG